MAEKKFSSEEYFKHINDSIDLAYEKARSARAKGYDPEDKVDITLAKNMAERVVALIGTDQPQLLQTDIPSRIKELETQYGKLDWRVALTISLEVAQEKFCSFNSKVTAMCTGIRIGLAYLTLGIVASPLEGFVELKIKKTRHNTDYFCLMYSGPIRSAGGTAGAVSVLISDYIRKSMGYDAYDPDEKEVNRLVTELYDYHERVTNLQYLPSEKEIEFIVKHLPVQIDGDSSEEIEVSNYKDLDRIEANKIRSGPCLVLGECVAQKSSKVWAQLSKWKSEFNMDHWDFLKEFVDLQKSIKSKKKVSDSKDKIVPVYTYISDLVAGRPVLTHPLREGGFRLRYGRCRTTGYSAAAIHPATMHILDKYIAIGTQLKVERPGKAASISSCDTIEGPIVKLKDGSVHYIDTEQKAKMCFNEVQEIIFLGDILFSFGDFLNRAHVLVPPGYCEEWWALELEKESISVFGKADAEKIAELTGMDKEKIEALFNSPLSEKISAKEAAVLSKILNVPLHPFFTYHWNLISISQLADLIIWLISGTFEFEIDQLKKIVLKKNDISKRTLELLGVPHIFVNNEYVVIESEQALILSLCLNLGNQEKIEIFLSSLNTAAFENTLAALNTFSPVILRDKSGVFIGARMGRPEKAKIRKMKGDPHTLFPVGEQGGKMRSLNAALQIGKIVAEFPIYLCATCNTETIFPECEKCKTKTVKAYYCKMCGTVLNQKCIHGTAKPFRLNEIKINDYFIKSLERLKTRAYPDLIKGVRGTSNKNHFPEHFIKGILRAKHNVHVNKDGTIRYDMTQLPITHFKPKEIGTPMEILRKLGYAYDIHGNNLVDIEQVLELKPQDIILPSCPESPDEVANKVLFNVANFIDELLVYFYELEPFYKLKREQDLIGHLAVAVAPHTSAGIVCRIIGYSKTQCFYAHPMIHAATRRDCDGDEASIILLMDALLNFSRQFLPNTRGATQDAPLVLTSNLFPSEVDDMLFDLDVVWKYPLEFYNGCLEFKPPSKIPIERFGSRLNTEKQYSGLGYTHEVSNLNNGVRCSSYKTIPTMEDKLKGQMELADKIRAVDASDVARLVIEKHLIRDIKGNLRKFSTQQFRCTKCNSKYRRPPLIGKCYTCGSKLIFTVTEGAIIKYLEPALSLAEKYNLPAYLKQTLELTKDRVEGTFGKDKDKQEGLNRWFG